MSKGSGTVYGSGPCGTARTLRPAKMRVASRQAVCSTSGAAFGGTSRSSRAARRVCGICGASTGTVCISATGLSVINCGLCTG